MGRRAVTAHLTALLVTASWIAVGLGPSLTFLTDAASGGLCFVRHFTFQDRSLDDRYSVASLSISFMGGLALAALVGSVNAFFSLLLARRRESWPWVPAGVAALLVVFGLFPYVGCRWGRAFGDSALGVFMLATGLTIAVSWIIVTIVGRTGTRSSMGADAG